jgi:hypothetical protein
MPSVSFFVRDPGGDGGLRRCNCILSHTSATLPHGANQEQIEYCDVKTEANLAVETNSVLQRFYVPDLGYR